MRLGGSPLFRRSHIAVLGLTLTACEWVLGMGSSSRPGAAPVPVAGGSAGAGAGGFAGRTASGGSAARGDAGAQGGTVHDAGAAGNDDEPSAGRGGSSGARGGATSGGRGGATSGGRGGASSGGRGGKPSTSGGAPSGGLGAASSAGASGETSTSGGALAGGVGGVTGLPFGGEGGESDSGPGTGGLRLTPLGGQPFGATRVDGIEHVLYTTNDAHIAEIYLFGNRWYWADLHEHIAKRPGHSMPPPGHSPFAFRMSDNSDSIVYVDLDGFIVELSLRTQDWEWQHLGRLLPESGNAGPPIGYPRADTLAGVAYVNTTTGHLHALSLSWGGQWTSSDLTDLTGADASRGTPFALQRTDGLLSIFAQARHGGGSIVEVLGDGTDWSTGSLGGASSGPTGFIRSDGVSSLIYVDTSSGHVLERTLDDHGWSQPFDLAAATGAPEAMGRPFGFRRTDGVSSIVFQTLDRHVHELIFRDGAWSDAGSPTVSTQCPPVASKTEARPHVRPYGESTVYYGSAGKIHELLHLQDRWICNNLTLLAAY
jgi:hypothetical protein